MIRYVALLALSMMIIGCGSRQDISRVKEMLSNNPPNWSLLKNMQNIPFEVRANVLTMYLGNRPIGTGFIVNGKLFTNAHTAISIRITCKYKGCGQLTGSSVTQDLNIGELLFIDKNLDLGVYSLPSIEGGLPVSTSQVELSDKVLVIGYSSMDNEIVVSAGSVKISDSLQEVKPYFGYDADTISGMSGAAVFNAAYEVIGLHFGKPIDAKYNRAIPINLIADRYPQFF